MLKIDYKIMTTFYDSIQSLIPLRAEPNLLGAETERHSQVKHSVNFAEQRNARV
jgi:hypothetical protein